MSPPAAVRPPVAKLRSLAESMQLRQSFAQTNRKIVLTNGCFDLLHAGHLHFLAAARQLGDALFVALNSDTSVRALKGLARPILSEFERAYALSALACVDTIVLFDAPRLTAEIRALHPDIYVKAGDYSLESLDPGERSALAETGAEIRFLPFLPGYSTSDLIERIAAAASTGS